MGDYFLRTVESIDLDWSTVSDADFEQIIEGLPNVKYVSLVWCRQLTDAGLENLTELHELQELDLSQSHVTNAGLEHLMGLNRLTWVGLARTHVTDEGIKKLQHALPNCRIDR